MSIDGTGFIVNTTTQCNQKCSFCYLSLDNKDLPIEKAISTINNMDGKISQITLTGGETFLYPDLERLLSEIRNANLHLNVNTNCKIGADSILEKCNNYPTTFWISFSNYSIFTSLDIIKLRKNNHRVFLSVPLFELNNYEYNKLKNLANESDGVLLIFPTPSPYNEVVSPEYHEWNKRLEKTINLLLESKNTIFYEPGYRMKNSNNGKRCLSGKDINLHIDGLSYPCCLLVNRINGSKEIRPISINDSGCPIITSIDAIAPEGYEAECPLLVKEVNSSDRGSHLAYLFPKT